MVAFEAMDSRLTERFRAWGGADLKSTSPPGRNGEERRRAGDVFGSFTIWWWDARFAERGGVCFGCSARAAGRATRKNVKRGKWQYTVSKHRLVISQENADFATARLRGCSVVARRRGIKRSTQVERGIGSLSCRVGLACERGTGSAWSSAQGRGGDA